MRRNDNFVLNYLGDHYVLVPVGQSAIDFNGIMTLNDTAKFLWENLSENVSNNDLSDALVSKYDIDKSTADQAVNLFVSNMRKYGCLQDE